jgi:hypothetical protein
MYASRLIYHYYRDLVRFKLCGNPKQMLKTVAPSEAGLFDRAAKVHIRFRLGGSTFPPKLYYKIYTHAPVADVGAFAPRDYAADDSSGETLLATTSSRERCTIRVGHSYYGASVRCSNGEPASHSGWYERVENNGWRPVAESRLAEEPSDAVEAQSRTKRIEFHYQRELREKRRIAKQKLAKRRWLSSMFKEKLAIDSSQGKYESYSASSTFDASEQDWEEKAECLLRWSGDLDFENYVREWEVIGTSGPSVDTC